ncbi:hypothetical protein SS1G_12677 [Sclerotinia sclerotiorum 1980 UF-70]|uniref:Inositol oxygenase n=1 Tax=Sclerotinia sclerotiorum (strain ATCC 18683 / 1980 / Ss-1) TaxID=665079 RepID=A7F502_SCLS1|nr:hypothetical protein SS1G_12677 [Sclerotinia sclerotiorum 1980 UF-70]EDN97823.1 hypothetical protein SS1G_12677 [Sclerotinia sclerotiorum 1980 UF-70]
MSSEVAVDVQPSVNGFGGQELERISDNIDEVNVLAAKIRDSKDPEKEVLFHPDTALSQIEHLLQTAEAMRRDGCPRWMIVTGLIHDLGKLLSFFGASDQWEVVGDTFPVGCAFDEDIILSETFKNNPDYHNPKYNTKYGVYSPNCGLDNVMMSYGHDEYLYHVVKKWSTLPQEALDMIRYHSFYSMHSKGKYKHLMNEDDEKRLAAVKKFNPYDLYSKADEPPNVEELKPYYIELINEFFPQEIIEW